MSRRAAFLASLAVVTFTGCGTSSHAEKGRGYDEPAHRYAQAEQKACGAGHAIYAKERSWTTRFTCHGFTHPVGIAFTVESGGSTGERCYETPVGATKRRVPCSIVTTGRVPAEGNSRVKELLEHERSEIRRACHGDRGGAVVYRGQPTKCEEGWPPASN